MTAERAQAFTLEAFVAAVLLVAGLVFVLSATGVTPLSAGTSGGELAYHQAGIAAGLLDSEAANGSLRPSLLYWNASNRTFHGVGAKRAYTTGGPPTAFGAALNDTLDDRDVAFNVHVVYVGEDDRLRRLAMVRLGDPTDDAVRVSRTVTLYDDDVLLDAAGRPTNATLADTSGFYAPDAVPDNPVYNVVRVEVTVWRV